MMNRTAPVNVKIHQFKGKTIIEMSVNIMRFPPTIISMMVTRNIVMDFLFSGLFACAGSKVPIANTMKTHPKMISTKFNV